jgi:formate C-acetyltransferase
VSVRSGEIATYEAFYAAVKKHIAYMSERCIDYITEYERHYGEIYPDALLSAQYDHSVETGVDVYEGGAKYNNSSLSAYSIATLVDSIAAVKRLVFEDRRVTFGELREILVNDWQGQERLRLYARNLPEKYGNNEPLTDEITVDMSAYIASLINGKPNGRGGVFKASLFSVDHGFTLGKKTMATPDGRHAGDTNSKNLCATDSMDRKGITALIHSATKIDQTEFPNGVVLDVVLHPSAVSGEDGLEAFLGILKTYFALGGMAMHGNVFDVATLRAAQQTPEKYQTLQVRLCGWNVYFVNLSEEEQNSFIMQAENAV